MRLELGDSSAEVVRALENSRKVLRGWRGGFRRAGPKAGLRSWNA